MQFSWDPDKNRINIEKHGIGFATASRVFEGIVVTAIDDRHDYGETRRISIGSIGGLLVVVVVHTDRDGTIRIISARRANAAERKRYEQAIQDRTEP